MFFVLLNRHHSKCCH